MTLEITHAKSTYTYRINEYNNREIDRRRNRHNARWEWYVTCANADDARIVLLRLEQLQACTERSECDADADTLAANAGSH